MNPFAFLPLAADDDGEGRVTLEQIEDRLRAAQSGAKRVVGDSKTNVIASGVVAAVLIAAGCYLQGRRRGRKRATVLEVRRV